MAFTKNALFPNTQKQQGKQMMEELLGQVMAKILKAQIHEEPSFGAL